MYKSGLNLKVQLYIFDLRDINNYLFLVPNILDLFYNVIIYIDKHGTLICKWTVDCMVPNRFYYWTTFWLFRWVLNLLEKQFILLYGLLGFLCSWSCWASLLKNGLLPGVLVLCWLLLLDVRYRPPLCFHFCFFESVHSIRWWKAVTDKCQSLDNHKKIYIERPSIQEISLRTSMSSFEFFRFSQTFFQV